MTDEPDEDEGEEPTPERREAEATRRLMAKLRVFIREQLDDEERGVFGRLIAPALARTYEANAAEVTGYGMVEWLPDLPAALADELRAGGWRVVGIDDDAGGAHTDEP